MRNVFFLLLFSFGTVTAIAQIDANQLLGLINATSTEMNAISNPITGSLIFNTTENRVYQFDGTSWTTFANDSSLPIVLVKTAGYTLTAADDGTIITFNSATDITLTVGSGLPIGFNVSIYQIGTGKVSIIGAGGITIKNRLSRFKTAGIDAGAGLVCTAANVFHLTGDLKK